MASETIDFGIDLGTTNSAIAVVDGADQRVITNRQGATFTPSAVYIDKRGQVHVGQEAKQRYDRDQENVACEFKLRMGLGDRAVKHFPQTDRDLLPEELSAEVLKSLRADVQTAMGREVTAAVITVPAAFELPACDATKRAAELAGFVRAPLLQEPVAAALAYGFQQSSDRVFWLVYDFGGGTFDAAVIRVRDGQIQVVNHAGDNHLGGKLIDWDIVDQLFVPALTSQCKLSDFERGNTKWLAAFAKLKALAEEAKIAVCRSREPQEVWREELCEDDTGQAVDFEFTLTPEQLRKIVTPYATRSLNLCRNALSEKGLSGTGIERVLMVGGSSLIPWLREAVAEELGAPLEFSIDPITVVARGAAVFAGSQRMPQDTSTPVPAGTWRVELEYDPVGSDLEAPVGGRVHPAEGHDVEGCTIELVEQRSQWRSGKIPLGAGGVFMADVLAEKGRKCVYEIELSDSTGTRIRTEPASFSYTVGLEFRSAPLTHSIGVAMANNQLDLLLRKGDSLPARAKAVHRLAFAVHAGQSDAMLRIPLVEGENVSRADRNRLIGKIEVPATDIHRDLPAGSTVEITISIDESRLVTARAFVELLDEEFEKVVMLQRELADVARLREGLARERERLAAARKQANETGHQAALDALAKIDREEMLEQTESLLRPAESDPDSAQACENRMLDLRAATDDVEAALEWPTLVSTAQEELAEARRLVTTYGKDEHRPKMDALEQDLLGAIESGDPDLLRSRTEEVKSYGLAVLFEQPGFWLGYLDELEKRLGEMREPEQARQLIERGRRAANTGDIEGVKTVVRQLVSLLPEDVQKEVEAGGGFGGTTIR